jgi:hypothetical protein
MFASSILLLGCFSAPSVGVVSSLENVFPTTAAKGSPSAQLEAARGEWESFQIVVRAGSDRVTSVSAEARPLEGPGADVPIWLYRVGYLDIKTPSSIEGKTGPWPDALLPAVDSFVGERRNAFPFEVPRGESRAIWVEMFVPQNARAGVYHGKVLVKLGASSVTVPISLAVHRFALPKTSSLPVTFGFTGNALDRVHGPLSEAEMRKLDYLYGVSALRHRISLHGGSFDPPHFNFQPDGRIDFDFSSYDAEVGDFLDGKADRGGPAFGAKFSAIDLRLAWRLPPPQLEPYGRGVIAHLRERGWLGRYFDYTYDEPALEAFGKVRARADLIHRIAPEVPRLVTKELAPELVGEVEIWCPTVPFVDDKPGANPPPKPARSAYQSRLRRGERLWWYHACMSHGCDIIGGAYFTGWPSYVVDTPPVAQRIFEWLTFRYDMGGELYFNTVEGYYKGLDPFRDQYLHGGNGDGTLFYPGRPDRIGGHTQIPVESIRLARIRDGLEDYEYLKLHAERFGREATLRLVTKVARRTFDWEHRPERLLEVRHQIAAELDAAASRPVAADPQP